VNELPPNWPPLPAGNPPSVVDRKLYIRGLMLANLYERGESARVLSVVWGLAVDTVVSNAVAVSHVIRAGLDDIAPSELQAECVVMLRDAARDARKAAKAGDHAGAGKLRVAVAKELAAITGCAAPKRQQVEVTKGSALDWLTEPEGSE
jgi:hypothetical protein